MKPTRQKDHEKETLRRSIEKTMKMSYFKDVCCLHLKREQVCAQVYSSLYLDSTPHVRSHFGPESIRNTIEISIQKQPKWSQKAVKVSQGTLEKVFMYVIN
jgi:hypothetical protein